MTRHDPADYIAAAIAYALSYERIPTSADVRKDFQDLLAGEFQVLLPKAAIVAGLRLLGRQGVLEFQDDTYLPLVTIPNDFNERLARWRFLDEHTPANRILHRFMDGPHDWMRRILQSGPFTTDIVDAYGSVLDDNVQRSEPIESESAFKVRSVDQREAADISPRRGREEPDMSPIHIVNTYSPIVSQSAWSGDNADVSSSTTATWFSAWGVWIGAVATIATLAWAMHLAKVF